ncbi:hypothetical protein RUM44_006393 [Polyplax serrata]|uniref:Inositol hexakisphosphate and diphosphoinositol-pentakisphosphate kinase n=1 Tax=Polyplax serrata TaxID=468196 RepID=A0ABR1AHZ0_POLSC
MDDKVSHCSWRIFGGNDRSGGIMQFVEILAVHCQNGELSDDEVGTEEGKQVVVGICAMGKKSQSKPMKEILTRLEEFEYLKMLVFPEETILKKSVDEWPLCDCLISFHSKGFPLDKAMQYANLRNPFIINNLDMQYDIQDRRKVYALLEREGIEIPRYAVLDRDSPTSKDELIESEDHVEVNGVIFNKPFVEKPVSAEDHNIYIYYPTSAGGGSQRLFRKIGSRSSVYSPESRVRKTGSFIYEDFMPTDGTDVKVYTVGPDYAHAEARKSPALDGKVERDSEGKEIRYPVILSNAEKLISRKVCLAFKQTVCGFDLLRANGKSFVCDVNGFSFVKNSNKYYDDCAKILGNMILRELAPTLDIPWSVPFQLDDPPIVPTTFGKMYVCKTVTERIPSAKEKAKQPNFSVWIFRMELRCVVAVIRHGDRTPKQKMKVEVRHPKFFEIFEKYDGYKNGHVKLKRPKQLQEILDTARSLLAEIQHSTADPEIEEKQGKLEQLKTVLEMYGHFSGINRKVQLKYQPRGRPRGSSSDDDAPKEPSLVLILKWGGELTPAGRIQAEELGRIFRCMYPGGQGEYAGTQGLGLLRLHSTYRHDLKIYASDEGRVQMTAAAFAKGLLALEGELTPILVQMVKSANTNGLLDNDCDSSKYQNMAKSRLHELMQQDRDFTAADRELINPCNAISISLAMDFVKNPVKCCERVQELIQKLMSIVKTKKDDPKTKDAILYHGETWELMGRRWGKIDKDFCTKNRTFDISKIPDIYDCIKYDLQHNQHTLQFEQAEELYTYAKYLADIVIPQEYGLTIQEKLAIGQGICTPLLKKIKADLQRNIEECEESVNRLNPRYSHGVSSPGRHVRTRLYFTSESHVHSLLTVFRFGELLDVKQDEQWHRAMEYVSMVSELNYMSQIVIMLYEDPTKDPTSEERFHVELHFSPGVNCCVQKNLPPGPGFRPHSRNESNTTSLSPSREHSAEDLSALETHGTSTHLMTVKSAKNMLDILERGEKDKESETQKNQEIMCKNPKLRRVIITRCGATNDEKDTSCADKKPESGVETDDVFTDMPTTSKYESERFCKQVANKEKTETPVDGTCLISDGKVGNFSKKESCLPQSSSPIPIKARGCRGENESRSSDLAKDLTARLNRCLQDSEPRSRSFDNARANENSQKGELATCSKQNVTALSASYEKCASNCSDGVALTCPVNKREGGGSPVDNLPLKIREFSERAGNEGDYSVNFRSSSSRILIPKTVPLFLESSNDALPDSHLQISPDNKAGGFCFPEVTFSNLIRVKTKNLSKKDEYLPCGVKRDTKSKSGSVPADFIFSDDDVTERYRKGSIGQVDIKSIQGLGMIDEGKKTDSGAHEPRGVVQSEMVPNFVTDSEKNLPGASLAADGPGVIGSPSRPLVDTKSISLLSSGDPLCEGDRSNVKVSPLNHSTSFPSLVVKSENPHHHCKKPKPVIRADAPRRHRHSVAGHHHNFKQNLSYFKLYGISVGPTGVIFNQSDKTKNKLLGSTSSLFSTAVISGSSSAPNLRDTIGSTTTISEEEDKFDQHVIEHQLRWYSLTRIVSLESVAKSTETAKTDNVTEQKKNFHVPDFLSINELYENWIKKKMTIEACGGVPPIRPLETLHNALSLKQLDLFLEKMTVAPLYRTPTNTPPHLPSTPQPSSHPLGSRSWSEASSLVYSSGPSSPSAFGDIQIYQELNKDPLTLINSNLYKMCETSAGGGLASTFPQAPDLDQDLGSVGILLENFGRLEETQQSDVNGNDSGELTPVSVSSEFDYRNQQDAEEPFRTASKENPLETQPAEKDEGNLYNGFNEEAIKKKLDRNLSRLEAGEEEEDEEEERTITTVSLAQRESIVGFFNETDTTEPSKTLQEAPG